jgi:hypothetical protein
MGLFRNRLVNLAYYTISWDILFLGSSQDLVTDGEEILEAYDITLLAAG